MCNLRSNTMSSFGRMSATSPGGPGGELVNLPDESTGILPHGRYAGVEVQRDGTAESIREKLNFIGSLFSVLDNGGSLRADIALNIVQAYKSADESVMSDILHDDGLLSFA